MILILSRENDYSTNKVLDWLEYYNVSYIRYNAENTIDNIEFNNEGLLIEFNGARQKKKIDLILIKAYWYRRGNFSFSQNKINLESFTFKLTEHLWQEAHDLSYSIHNTITTLKPGVGNIFNNKLLKIDVLRIATNCGIKTPDTIVTNARSSLCAFKKLHESIITKSISNGIFWKQKDLGSIIGYTIEITDDLLPRIPKFFFSSLLQKKIQKKYDLRIFFLDGDFYSMAIFSQNDPQTKVDFRNYNFKKPNRKVPFKLPEVQENLLRKLTTVLGCNCASIDMLLDTNNNYYFLEINPVGQYGMVSEPCNYYLDKKIAEKLIQLSNEKV